MGSSPEDYQLCTVLFLLVQDMPLFPPAHLHLQEILKASPTPHMLPSIVTRGRFILFHRPVQHLYLLIQFFFFFRNDIPIIINSARFKERQLRPPGAHWLKAQEEEEPVSPKEWTSEYKYYSDYILLLLVQPHNRAPEMQIMSSGFQRQY